MPLNILVVDDSSVTRAMIIKTLKIIGLPLGEIYQAANGLEGIEALEENWVDIALVDVNMPIMNGEEMLRQLRETPEGKNLPVIMVSTEGSQTRIESLQEQGAKFVHKPFAPEAIRQAIVEITGISYEPTSTESDTDF